MQVQLSKEKGNTEPCKQESRYKSGAKQAQRAERHLSAGLAVTGTLTFSR